MRRFPAAFFAIGVYLLGVGCAAGQTPAPAADAAWDRLYTKGGMPWYDSQADQWRSVPLPDEGGNPESLLRHRHSTWQPAARAPRSQTARYLARSSWFQSGLVNQRVLTFIWIAMLAAAIAGLLWWAYHRGTTYRWQARQAADNQLDPSSQASLVPAATIAAEVDLWNSAHHRCACGDVPAALAYLYCYVLIALQQRGLVEFVPGKTSRDYAADLRSWPAIAERFALVADRYERAFFGRQEMSIRAVRECFQSAEYIVQTSSNVYPEQEIAS